MKRQYDSADAYYVSIFSKITKLLPIIAFSAALTFTGARISGFFTSVKPVSLICFDAACLLYFFISRYLKKLRLTKGTALDDGLMFRAELVISAIIVFQWNLISYIFPTRDFWGYAPMFVLLSAYMFHTKIVMITTAGISVSIVISWIVFGQKLLPDRTDMFVENMILRIVALLISFFTIYCLTNFAETFTTLAQKNAKTLESKNKDLEQMSRDIIDFTADIIEQRDATTGTHIKRLKRFTQVLAQQIAEDYPEYGLNEEKIRYISLASALHDIGKIGIPDQILLKPGPLSPEERKIINTHSLLGAQIIDRLPASMDEEYKRYCKEICEYHHEKVDGKGYPYGLKGDDIPISAQIVSVADCFDALTSTRPYKEAFSADCSIDLILDGQCGEFSDKIKNSLMKCRSQLTID